MKSSASEPGLSDIGVSRPAFLCDQDEVLIASEQAFHLKG